MVNLPQKMMINHQIIVNSQLLRKLLKEVKITYMNSQFMKRLD
jgi:hypothetical protein